MAFADPQSVTISGTPVPLARTGMTLDAGAFTSADRDVTFLVRHSSGKRTRHNVVLRQDKTIADPLVPSQNRPVSFQVSLTADLPTSGVTATDVADLVKAIVAWATPANVSKLLGGES